MTWKVKVYLSKDKEDWLYLVDEKTLELKVFDDWTDAQVEAHLWSHSDIEEVRPRVGWVRRQNKTERMTNYNPDNWVVIKMNGDDPHYRVLAGWSGGYLHVSSWRMNSGITRVEDAGDRFNFYGSTGSCYSCGKESYTLRMNNAHIWNQLKELHGDKVEMMPEETDWLAMDWIIK